MAKKKSFFESRGFKVALKYLYAWGASVVILGALFKILHWPGANEMLIVGLGTESVIFFISGLEPLPPEEKHWNWAKVFPQLKEEDEDEVLLDEMLGEEGTTQPAGPGFIAAGLQGTSTALQENLTPELFENLTETIKNLGVSVNQLSEVADVTVATNEFGQKLKVASEKIDQMTSSYSAAIDILDDFKNTLGVLDEQRQKVLQVNEEYQQRVMAINKSLEELNAIYESELKDAQKHLNTINHFYANLNALMENLASEDVLKDATKVREELSKLAVNMERLNAIYGSMLTAMSNALKA